MNTERDYLNLLEKPLYAGKLVQNRTGTPAYMIPHVMLQFDMADGFPLITTKKMAWKSIRAELEFFIKGLTDKRWLQQRGVHIWDEWCDPTELSRSASAEERKLAAKNNWSLGPVYGYQWRNFNGSGIDQLRTIVDQLKTNPLNRQLVCSAWNPCQQDRQALPPCHVLWHVTTDGDRLHLCWFQRSCDAFLGVPFNIASYALLLHLLAREAGMVPGVLTGFFSNWHVYQNHEAQVREQIRRSTLGFPRLVLGDPVSIFEWEHDQVELQLYNHHPAIKGEIAV